MFFSVKVSRTTARSREVLILSLFVCRDHSTTIAARERMAWDPVAFDGRLLAIFRFWLAVANVVGCEVSPADVYRGEVGKRDSTYSLSCADGFRVAASAGGRRSSSTVHEVCWRSALVVPSQSLHQICAGVFLGCRSQLYVRNTEHAREFSVFSAVIGVFSGLISASVRMHRNGLRVRSL